MAARRSRGTREAGSRAVRAETAVSKGTSAKGTSARAASAKPAAPAEGAGLAEAVVALATDAAPEGVTAAQGLGKRELVDRVAEAAGVTRRVARPVVEAVLAELGRALSRGETLNLRPLGKAQVARTRPGPKAEVLVVKIRRPHADTGGGPDGSDRNVPTPLAEAAE